MLTLLEAAKIAENRGEFLRAGIIKTYAEKSELLRVIPFQPIKGSAMRYNQEGTLPSVGFRAIGGSWTASTGVINPMVEPLVIAGGEIDVDNFVIATMGEGVKSVHAAMKIKALAHNWTLKFFKGDSVTTSAEMDGLQNRLSTSGDQVVDAGSTSGGDALSLAKLDELIDATEDPTHIVMNKAMRRRLKTAARDTSVGGYVTYSQDEFGRQLMKYQDLPILIADKDEGNNLILPFTEANPGGGSAASTSIYCLSLKEGMLHGIESEETQGMKVTDFGEVQASPKHLVRNEWYVGLALLHPRAASRLRGIKDAVVTT